jgi:hypothetical protein
MKGERSAMRSLTNTYLFSELDKENSLSAKIAAARSPAAVLPLEKLKFSLDVIDRRFNFLLRARTVGDVKSGLTVPVFAEGLSLPAFLPAFGYADAGELKVYANLTGIGHMDKQGNFEVDPRKLFAHLHTATIIRICSESWTRIQSNVTLMKASSQAYAKMLNKVLDKTYAVNLNRMRADVTSFASAKFFLSYVFGREPGETTDNAAYLACFNGTTRPTVNNAVAAFPEGWESSLRGLVDGALAGMDGLKGLSIRSLLEAWIKTYDLSAVLALEYYPFLLHALFAAMVGAHVNAEYVIDPLVGRETTTIYGELARSLR